MKKLRAYEVVIILSINFFDYFVSYSMDPDKPVALCPASNGFRRMFIQTKVGRTCLEAFIKDPDGASKESFRMGTKITYLDGTVVIHQENRSLLYQGDIIYLFDSNGLLEKEIGK